MSVTEIEAKTILERDLNCLKGNKALPDSVEAMEVSIKALEKQIPKQIVTKVQAEDLKVGHVTFKAGTKTYYCPACNNAITLASSYCGWCGQAVVLGVDK